MAVSVQLAPELGQFEVHAAQGFVGVVNGFAGDPHGAVRCRAGFPGGSLFQNSQYRAEFRLIWHRFTQKLPVLILTGPQ
jgi:hypothetical protein